MPERPLHGPGFHHIALRTGDFDGTLRFYQEGFGFRRVYGWGEGDGRAAMLDTGDGNYLEVFAGGRTDDTQPPEGALLHFALRTGDLQADWDRALRAGAVPMTPPKAVEISGDRPVTVHIAFCQGPNGEVIELFQNDEL